MKKLRSLVFVLLLAGSASAQCPMCKAALSSGRGKDGTKGAVGNGINKGILFLLSMPYLLVGTAGTVWYLNRRKKKHAGS